MSKKLLLKAGDIAQMPGEQKIHFLNPNAVRLSKSLGDATGMQNLGVHLVSVEPGRDTTEYHIHYYEEECLYILSGTGLLILDGEEFEVGAGDFVGLPVNTAAHNLINNSKDTLVFLVMGQRLEQDIGDYPNKGKRLYRYSGQRDLVDIDKIENNPRSR